MIDATDRQIIGILQRDGRMSNVDIARLIGVAEGTVRKRIERLLADGAIRVVAVPDASKLGFDVETVIMIRVDLGRAGQIADQLAAMREVRSVRYATGEYDLIVDAVFASDEELLRFLTVRLAPIQGINATATSHVLKNIKLSDEWVLPSEGSRVVLIVDDDPDFVEVTRLVLEKAGFRVISASNGEQGIAAMRREAPDLVILDVMMSSILDGLEASKRIKSEVLLRRTPIMMVSSIASSDYAGMFPTDEYVPVENFLSKPVSPQQLLQEVQRLLL